MTSHLTWDANITFTDEKFILDYSANQLMSSYKGCYVITWL